jgi:hypothetical protein
MAKSICKTNTVCGLGISYTASDSYFYSQIIEKMYDNALAKTIRGTELWYNDLLFKQYKFFISKENLVDYCTLRTSTMQHNTVQRLLK